MWWVNRKGFFEIQFNYWMAPSMITRLRYAHGVPVELPSSEGPRGRAIEGSWTSSAQSLYLKKEEGGFFSPHSIIEPLLLGIHNSSRIQFKNSTRDFSEFPPTPKFSKPPSGKIYTVKEYFNKIVYSIEFFWEKVSRKDRAKRFGINLAWG
jgi:hypothetical protein